jgi:hypothetical protein
MFGSDNLILIFVTYSQPYPQKLWIENQLRFLLEIQCQDTWPVETAAWL